MARPPQRPRSLMPLITLLAVALIAAVAVLVGVRAGDEDAPPRAVAPAPATTQDAPPTRTATGAARAADDEGAAFAAERAADRARWPLAGERARRARVPILMYHVIADAPPGTAFPDLWVGPDRFAAQVAALADAGFSAITMAELWAAWHDGGRLPERPIVLSFDDGGLSHAMGAAPVLLERRWPGVLNLTVQNLGKDGLPMWGARRLLRQGWEIGSHTSTHPDITTLDDAGLTRELAGSRRAIKRQLGVEPEFFCYPAGRNDARSRAAVKAAGYLGATTVEPGIAARTDDPFLLPRIRVEPSTTPQALVGMARGG